MTFILAAPAIPVSTCLSRPCDAVKEGWDKGFVDTESTVVVEHYLHSRDERRLCEVPLKEFRQKLSCLEKRHRAAMVQVAEWKKATKQLELSRFEVTGILLLDLANADSSDVNSIPGKFTRSQLRSNYGEFARLEIKQCLTKRHTEEFTRCAPNLCQQLQDPEGYLREQEPFFADSALDHFDTPPTGLQVESSTQEESRGLSCPGEDGMHWDVFTVDE